MTFNVSFLRKNDYFQFNKIVFCHFTKYFDNLQTNVIFNDDYFQHKKKRQKMNDERKQCIFLANTLGQCERYAEMISYMKRAIDLNPILTYEERNILVNGYKSSISPKRQGLRNIFQREMNDGMKDLSEETQNEIKAIKKQITTELVQQCEEIIDLINDKLIPSNTDPEAIVSFNKLKGDYYRYICEATEGNERLVATKRGTECYESALQTSKFSLQQFTPTALVLILNYTVFLYEICDKKDLAIRMAREMVSLTSPLLEQNSARSIQEARTILDLLNNNINLWQQQMQYRK